MVKVGKNRNTTLILHQTFNVEIFIVIVANRNNKFCIVSVLLGMA